MFGSTAVVLCEYSLNPFPIAQEFLEENSVRIQLVRKERGHYCTSYTFVTVLVRNAANLAHILPKASRTTLT
jgi:hypothetical protein